MTEQNYTDAYYSEHPGRQLVSIPAEQLKALQDQISGLLQHIARLEARIDELTSGQH